MSSARSSVAAAATLALVFALALPCGCSRRADDAPASGPRDETASRAPQVPTFGLVDAPGYELVVRNCILCHGARQFLQQRGDAATWRGLIRWMQRDHGLWPLAPADEDGIVAYLATHYAPDPDGGRRAPLAPELMPPNPYDEAR